jgi:hypothetical protein
MAVELGFAFHGYGFVGRAAVLAYNDKRMSDNSKTRHQFG